jgi:UDP-N-acetylmuramoyl-tripeptide--D-alanyl-D-alanine ligase
VPSILAWLIAVHFVPLSLVLATLLLAPSERRVQAKYWREAESVLQRVKPTVIGITGSYGKTSTKHLLAHILSVQAPTLATPGSVNTAMGIARIVRERLDRQRWFVVEMGAYGRGSIATLCALTPPKLGILTTIGKAHYERFGSVDEVAAAKLELAEAAERNGGRVIFGSGAMRHPAVRAWAEAHKPMVVEARILDTAETPEGLAIAVDWQGARYDLKVPIHGLQQVDNIVLAFAAACSLGVPPSVAAQALASAPQIQHRLEVKTLANGAVLIDDAYNSNPEGFAAGLRLLDLLRKSGGRRILVTPGMVELGVIEDAEHEAIGRLAGGLVDVLLAVSPARIAALTKAYKAANPQGVVVPCATFASADRWMAANLQANDVVLLENDLPDLYELKLRL